MIPDVYSLEIQISRYDGSQFSPRWTDLEAVLFMYDERQQWYYFSDMKMDELLAFKLYDSRKGSREDVRTPLFSITEKIKAREELWKSEASDALNEQELDINKILIH